MTVEAIVHNGSHALATNLHAALILGTSTPLLLLSSSLFLVQLYLRLKSVYRGHYRLGWDDAFLILAALFNIVAFAALLAAIVYATDSKATSQNSRVLARIALWVSIARPLWIWSSVWAKISLAITIMRVKVSPRSRALMTSFIIIVPAIVFSLWLPAMIHRHSTRLDLDIKVNHGLYLGIALVFLLANIVLTIPAISFLFSKRPLGERIIASFLCFLGACAVACSIGRVILQTQKYTHTIKSSAYNPVTDGTLVPYVILACVEASINIIAACTPTVFHFAAKAVHLVPLVYRDRLTHRKSTLRSRRDNATPEIHVSDEHNSGFLDRWSRDLGLDALPDNPRFSTNPRMSRSWLSWRSSAMFAAGNRNTLASTQEAANEETSQAPASVHQPLKAPAISKRHSPRSAIELDLPQVSAPLADSLTAESPLYSKTVNRWSLWAPMANPPDAPLLERRRSSSLSAWLQWQKIRGQRKSTQEQIPKTGDQFADESRVYAEQTQVLSFEEASEKSKEVSSPMTHSSHTRSQNTSLGSSQDQQLMSSPVASASIMRDPCAVNDESSPEPVHSTSEILPPEYQLVDEPDEKTIADNRPLSWESAQHQYFEPQLSAGLDAPPNCLWGSLNDTVDLSEESGFPDEDAAHWPPSSLRPTSFVTGDDGAGPTPSVLTIRNL